MKNQLKDTGHLRNCTAFEQLVAVCSSIDTLYRPSNPAITLAAISELSIKAPQSVNDVMSALNNYYAAVDLRTQLFSDLLPKATRIVNYFRSCGVSEASMANLTAYNKQLQGTKKKEPAAAPPAATEAPEPQQHRSNSKRSYDSLAQHFLSMVDVLKKEPSYQPLEEDFTVAQLSAFHQQLLQSSLAVAASERLLSDARSRRNQLLYKEGSGMKSLSQAIKAYIRAVFGAHSHEYELVKGIVIRSSNK